jgi:hypothetical protein
MRKAELLIALNVFVLWQSDWQLSQSGVETGHSRKGREVEHLLNEEITGCKERLV